ncbi:hypothetical protein F5Y09DRAFT_323777 [Xylaria sp. FL1042]|nr:hypothetical protein F5Y09DRAFT_323777 [Xylaria sp. FL1042]
MGPRPPVRGKFSEKQQGLSEKIQQKWGVLPWEMFPDGSCHHPKTWTSEILQALNNLAGVASLERATAIFDRTDSPITKEQINNAITKCLWAITHQTSAPTPPKTPVNSGTDAKDVVFVVNDEESHRAHLARMARRADSLMALSERPSRTGSCSDNIGRITSDSPPAKRRKTQDESTKLALSPTLLTTATEPPNSPLFKLNVPFPCEDATRYAQHISSLILWGRQNLENQRSQHSREVYQASRRLETLQAEETKLNKTREQAENEQKIIGGMISKFEEIVESMLDIEKQQDQLVARQDLLEARKCEIMPADSICTQSPCCEQNQAKETPTRLRKSQSWLLELDDLKHKLSTIIEHKDETLGKIQTVKRDFAAAEKQLQEGEDALVRADKELKKWKMVTRFTTDGFEAAGLIPQQRSLEESI